MQRVSTSAELLRGPEATEDCWATVNGTLLGNRKLSRTEQLSIHGGSRLLSRFCAAKLFGVIVQRVTTSAELSRGPEPTEDCWATVNGTLLSNRELSRTD